MEPCRLFDYRAGEDPAAGKKTPLVAGAPATQQVTGTIGNCSIPTVGVVAVSMNVTVVQGTAQSNLRLYPADAATEPVVSNLNWKAGDSATANKVDVKLSSIGAVKVAVAGGEISSISHGASAPGLDPYGAFDDFFVARVAVFVAGPGPHNASEWQYTITYSAADGRSVLVFLVTEDDIGANGCVVSGFAMGAP